MDKQPGDKEAELEEVGVEKERSEEELVIENCISIADSQTSSDSLNGLCYIYVNYF